MQGISYYSLDTETNGLSTKAHEVTEISIIRHSNRVQLTRNIICERPENSSVDALRITGKTMADLLNGLPKADVVAECNKFFNEDGLTPAHRCIVGHNIISFDKRFLHALWESVGETFPAILWLDTMQLTKHYAKQIGLVKPKVNLDAACNMLEIKKAAGMHNAKSDTRNCYLLWKALIEDKKVDYLPFIKTAAHSVYEPLNPDDLDNE